MSGIESIQNPIHPFQFPPGLYFAYATLEAEENPERRRAVLQQIVEKITRFAPGWQQLADSLSVLSVLEGVGSAAMGEADVARLAAIWTDMWRRIDAALAPGIRQKLAELPVR